MSEDEGLGRRAQSALGLSADTEQPAGSALAASLIAGAIVAAFLWFVVDRGVAVVVFLLALVQGLVREFVRWRANS